MWALVRGLSVRGRPPLFVSAIRRGYQLRFGLRITSVMSYDKPMNSAADKLTASVLNPIDDQLIPDARATMKNAAARITVLATAVKVGDRIIPAGRTRAVEVVRVMDAYAPAIVLACDSTNGYAAVRLDPADTVTLVVA